MTERTRTSTAECDLERSVILDVLSDLNNLPRWAPAFAPVVEVGAGGECTVVRGDERFTLRAAISGDGCVDYLRTLPGGGEGGAFIRVLPRPGGGSVVVMTVPVQPGARPSNVRANLEAELERLILVCAVEPARDVLRESIGE